MRVLVTGGSGAFGAAFIRRLAATPGVEKVACYSRGEHAQAALAESMDLNLRGDGSNVRFFIGDVRDERRLRMAMRGMTHVVHAAALKVVPAGEYNPTEFTKTNVFGAANVIECAIETGVQRVVALSTDKACSPVNLYGASKLCAEKAFVAANAYAGGGTTFSVVRYGNVTGSTGSVVPFWWKRATERKPLPVTDVTMTRFWMTLDDAVDFVLWVLEHGRGGEVFIPELPTYNLMSLAQAIWAQATGRPAEEVEYEVTGVRGGEKFHESMVAEDEAPWCWHDRENRKLVLLTSGDVGPRQAWHKVDPGFSYKSDGGLHMSVKDLQTELAKLGWFTVSPTTQAVPVYRARG